MYTNVVPLSPVSSPVVLPVLMPSFTVFAAFVAVILILILILLMILEFTSFDLILCLFTLCIMHHACRIGSCSQR